MISLISNVVLGVLLAVYTFAKPQLGAHGFHNYKAGRELFVPTTDIVGQIKKVLSVSNAVL